MAIIENIKVSKLEELDAKLVKLAKRAAKVGAPVPAYQVTAIRNCPRKVDSEGAWVPENIWYEQEVDVRVIGDACSIEGHALIAVIDTSSFDENVIKTVPGAELPAELRETKPVCDHCGLDRKRKDIVVLRTPEGKHIRLGRACVGLYLPGGDPRYAIESAKWIEELSVGSEESDREGRDGQPELSPELLLIHAAAIVRHRGFVSKGAAREAELNDGRKIHSTAELVCDRLFRDDDQFYKVFRPEILAEDYAAAKEIVAWAQSIDDTFGLNEYGRNLRIVVGAETIEPQYFGLAISAIGALRRWLSRDEARKAKAAKPASQFVGAPKKRQDFVVTCEKVIAIEGFYGLTGLHLLSDEHGNRIKWFASASAEWLEEGAVAKIKATVKSHEVYQGEKETVVQRAKVLEIKEAA